MKRRIYFAYAVSLFCISAAYADDPDSIVNFDCNKEEKQLLIETFSREVEPGAPYPRIIKPSDSTISVRGLMWAVESENGRINWHRKEVRRVCRFGQHMYVATLKGYKFDENIQGMCGGGSPDLSLTVHKNGKLIVKDLRFNNSCDSHAVIESIRFLPKTEVAIVGTRNQNDRGSSELRITTKTPLTMERLFNGK